jgi:hypothetical protein
VTTASEVVKTLLRDLNARAVGLWHVEGHSLVLDVFHPAEDLPADVASGFAQATESVSLDLLDLGIVRAALHLQVTVSKAADLPPHTGSGYWLRAFSADRSIAVPLENPRKVLSVAVPNSCSLDDESVAHTVRRFGSKL